MTKRRIITAFLVAPLTTPLVFFLLFQASNPLRDVADHFFLVTCVYLPFAYAAEFSLGILTWMIFLHYRISSLLAFAVGGAIIGLIVALILRSMTRINDPFMHSYAPLCIVAASASAVVFRSIAFRNGEEKQ